MSALRSSDWASRRVAGWGRALTADMALARPERVADIGRAIAAAGPGGAIARGGGRSYGDAALGAAGFGIELGRLDRLLAFDPTSGALVAEAGVTFADLLAVFLPRGFLAPVTPGTGFATLGGALANDVHGKNHDRVGSFGDHVLWFDLVLASGETRRVTPDSDPELFRATIGGIGLTGVVSTLAVKLLRAPSTAFKVRMAPMAGLEPFLAALEGARAAAGYSVGWIDGLARGGALGRGVLETAEFADPPQPSFRPRRRLSVPIALPLVKRASIALLNRFYAARTGQTGQERIVPAEAFLYPLDALGNWNRLYGRKGFAQFQCVLPDAGAAAGLRALLQAPEREGVPPALVVIKTLGIAGRGYLSFALRGVTLALDVAMTGRTPALLERLADIALDHGGRVYLAKDAALSATQFARMYPQAEKLRAVKARVDPDGRFCSAMAQRLGLMATRA
ncbi:MAG: FAD-binding oxidoreductase [Alphaproteobacteria bacterium]|nr:FAD-binding oxidoreductase [Alphaproteobacteria bacterium]